MLFHLEIRVTREHCYDVIQCTLRVNFFKVTAPDEFRCGKVDQKKLNTLGNGELRSMEVIKINVLGKSFN